MIERPSSPSTLVVTVRQRSPGADFDATRTEANRDVAVATSPVVIVAIVVVAVRSDLNVSRLAPS